MGFPGDWSKVKDQTHVSNDANFCEHRAKRPMTWRLQGETDSFGAEYWYYCDECAEEEKRRQQEYRKEHENDEEECDWCGGMTPRKYIRNHRDFEEGSAGRVYRVCDTCINRETLQFLAEIENL